MTELAPVVLVTGAAVRVGAAIAEALHRAGANVVVHFWHSALAADELVDQFNARRAHSAVALQANLNDLAAAEGLVSRAVAHFGRLDGLVNNASSFYPTPLGQVNEADWADLMGSNARAPFFLAQAAAPHLKEARGAVVNITDIHAERPLPGYPVYSAAKGALLAMTRALAIELAPEVRVNAVAPGPILWPEGPAFDPAARQTIIADTLLKRVGAPEDIARAVRFLLLEATYVTGQVLNVDGGRTAHL